MTYKGNVYLEGVSARMAGLAAGAVAVRDWAHDLIDRTGLVPETGGVLYHHPDGTRCPCCDASLIRVRRTLGDRLASVVTPRHRYRCESWKCRWEGALPVKC